LVSATTNDSDTTGRAGSGAAYVVAHGAPLADGDGVAEGVAEGEGDGEEGATVDGATVVTEGDGAADRPPSVHAGAATAARARTAVRRRMR
jgi:hypothetical protein